MNMDESIVSSRYAKALFEKAKELEILEGIRKDMLLIEKTCRTRSLRQLLNNPVFSSSKKKNILFQIFDQKLYALSFSLIKLLVKNKREAYIPDIANNFLSRYIKEKNIKTVYFTSAATLEKDMEKKISTLLKENFHTEVELHKKTNPDLIGGFIIRIDDMQYDVSVKNQLKKTKETLLNEN